MNSLGKILVFAAVFTTGISQAMADEEWDTYSDTWIAVDELGRKVAVAGDGVEREEIDADACVGMFYYVWHGQHNESGKDITELLNANPDNPQWGAKETYHWGSKPWLGYYKAGDKYVVSRHMQMLVDAGVDFLFFDATNAIHYPVPVKAVMAELDRRESLGLKNPKLAFMLHSNTPQTIRNIYSEFYRFKKYEKYWFYYDGKPLILADKNDMAGVPETILNYFTFRNSWAWMQGKKQDEWSWLEYYPQEPGWTLSGDSGTKKVEQISVSVAQHATTKVGKSYHNGKQPELDKYALCAETPYGLYFQEQWDRALAVHPPLVMVTQFNEWIALRFVISSQSQFNDVRPGATASIGESYFVDVYNAEFSRDLEPSTHPLIRDNYYLQLISNVRKYRGARPIPTPTVNKTIDINSSFSQWDAETVEYRDDKGDADITSKTVQTASTLLRPTNDIVVSKVTQDSDNIYFYVRTAANISSPESSNLWMRLLLNTDTDYSTGWWGYDYCVYKDSVTGLYSLMKHDKNFKWTTIAPVTYRIEANEMHLSIPRHQIGLQSPSDIDFKWADNISDDEPDIMTFISDGDVAPNGRFNYRYKGSAMPASELAPETLLRASQLETLVNGGGAVTLVNHTGKPMNVAVYDVMGHNCFNCEDITEQVSFHLSKGVYVVHYSADLVSGVQKFMCH